MDKKGVSVALGIAVLSGIASVISGKNKKVFSFSSESWMVGDDLPPQVQSMVKEYIESGQNPKGIGSLMPKILSQITVQNQDKGRLIGALNNEARKYTPGAPVIKRKAPKFAGTPFKNLPPLPKGKDEYVLRMAPNPNAALTMAHGLGILVNELYVEKYKEAGFKAKSVLRLDDTDPDEKPPLADFYKDKSSLVFQDYRWMSGKDPDITYIASDNYKDHYQGIERLMNMRYKGRMGGGMAYLVEGMPGTSIESNMQRCRAKSVEENIQQFQWLVNNQKSFYVSENGEIVQDDNAPMPEIRLRLSPAIIQELAEDLMSESRAMKFQDAKIMRLCKNPHPRHPDIRLWPTLKYQGPFDDWVLNTSHVVRGADLIDQEDFYHFFYPYVFSNWSDWHSNSQLPVFLYWPRFNFIDMDKYLSFQDPKTGKTIGINTMSSSALSKIVKNPPFNGNWEHEDLPTINSLRLKGYKPAEVKRWWFSKFEKKYATSYGKAELLRYPLQERNKDGSVNFNKNWYHGRGIIKVNGLNINFIPPVKSFRKPKFQDMNYEETIGYLNNLVQNCPKDINQWDSSEFEEFMSNLSKGMSKLRLGDLQF